jgi:hypothetical protein
MYVWTLFISFLAFLLEGVVVPIVRLRFNLFQAAWSWHRHFHPAPVTVSTNATQVVFTPGRPYLPMDAVTVVFTPGTPTIQSRYL